MASNIRVCTPEFFDSVKKLFRIQEHRILSCMILLRPDVYDPVIIEIERIPERDKVEIGPRNTEVQECYPEFWDKVRALFGITETNVSECVIYLDFDQLEPARIKVTYEMKGESSCKH